MQFWKVVLVTKEDGYEDVKGILMRRKPYEIKNIFCKLDEAIFSQ